MIKLNKTKYMSMQFSVTKKKVEKNIETLFRVFYN